MPDIDPLPDAPLAVEPLVEPVPPAVDPVDPAPLVEPVPPLVEPVPGVEPVALPVDPAPVDEPVDPAPDDDELADSSVPRTSTREFTYFCKSLCCPPTSLKDWPAPLPDAIEPEELPDVDPAPPAVDPVDPAPVDPAPVDPAPVDPVPPLVDPVPPAVEPVEPAPDVEPVEPVLEPVAPAPLAEPVDPLPDAPLERLALVSMKLPPAPDALPLVPVAPVVPVEPDAVLPLPEPDTRHPVATTCPWLELPLVLPVCPCDPLGVCAAAPAPSATAIIVPKRNCRFITSSVLGE